MNKTKSVIFEFNTTFSNLKINTETLNNEELSNSQLEENNAISAIRQNRNNKYDMYKYNYELLIVEERYNVLYIKNGLVELKYAK